MPIKNPIRILASALRRRPKPAHTPPAFYPIHTQTTPAPKQVPHD